MPRGYSYEEAERICAEHQSSPDVRNAHPVTFGGTTHVHLDLEDGDIVVFGPDEEDTLTIEAEWYPEDEDD